MHSLNRTLNDVGSRRCCVRWYVRWCIIAILLLCGAEIRSDKGVQEKENQKISDWLCSDWWVTVCNSSHTGTCKRGCAQIHQVFDYESTLSSTRTDWRTNERLRNWPGVGLIDDQLSNSIPNESIVLFRLYRIFIFCWVLIEDFCPVKESLLSIIISWSFSHNYKMMIFYLVKS